MNTPNKLIRSDGPVQRFSWSRPTVTAGIAVVGKTAGNQYEVVNQLGKLTPYRLIFEVDVSDHHDVVTCELPSRGDVFTFHCNVIIDWRVTDPIAVVVRQINDGLALCTAHLIDRMRAITRRFAIEDSADAEAEVRMALGGGPISLPEGITMHRVQPQLTIDDAARNAGQAQVAAVRDGSLAAIRGRSEVGAAKHKVAIQRIEQDGELDRRQRSMDAIQAALQGNYDPIAIHLGQHPEQTGELLNMIRSDFQANADRRDNLIMELLRQGLIQDIDVADLNASLLGSAADSYRAGPQRTIGGPRIVQGNVVAPAGSLAAAQSEPRIVPSAHEEAEQETAPADGSGVAGWRRLPPRPAD